jgi:hypothetical protein
MKTRTLLTAFLLLAILAGIFFFGRSCKQCDNTATSTPAIDSLLSENARQAADLKRFQDSAEKLLDTKDAVIVTLQVEKDQAAAEARKSKEKALFWAEMYKKAKAAGDTEGQLYACDSLENEFQSYIVRVDAYIVKSDSVIHVQHETIQMLQQLSERQKNHIASQQRTFDMVAGTNADLVKSNNQLQADLKKAKKWGNRKMVIGAAIGGGLGYKIK